MDVGFLIEPRCRMFRKFGIVAGPVMRVAHHAKLATVASFNLMIRS